MAIATKLKAGSRLRPTPSKVDNARIVELIEENFELRPQAIIDTLQLRRPIFRQTAAYGHFGREDLNLPWEQLDKVDVLKAAIA